MKTKPADTYYTPQELSALLKRSENTLKGWRRTGYGPKHSTQGRLVRYPKSEVDDWLSDPQAYQDVREEEEDT